MEKQEVDILIKNGLFITLDPARRILKDGAVAVRADRIVEVGKTDKLETKYEAVKIIDASDMVVTPGFINGHAHVSGEHITRGAFPDDLVEDQWGQWAGQLYNALTPEDEYYSSLFAFIEMIKTGTTSFCEGGTMWNADKVVEAMKTTGIRGVIGRWTWDVPKEIPKYAMSSAQAIRNTETLINDFHGVLEGRVRVWPLLLGMGTASRDLLIGAKELADQYQVGLSFHQSAEPMEKEMLAQVMNTSKAPVEVFEEIGILDKNLQLIHMASVNDEEIELLANYDVKVVHCPSAMKLGIGCSQIGKYPEMIEKGVCVSIGCDGANSSHSFDMVRAVFLEAIIHKDSRMDARVMPAETALEMATINGAKSLLMEKEVGSIEIGKKADIVLFNTRTPEWLPILNVVNNLVYSANGSSVDTVLIDGHVVLEDGRITLVDEEEVYRKVQEKSLPVLQRAGLSADSRWTVE